MKKANMIDIARESGYSIATVSRVLNKTGKYSKEAEEKILKIAEEMQYSPDIGAQGLRRQKGKSIGVIIPSMDVTYYCLLGQMIQHELLLQDYYPVFISLGSREMTADRVFTILRSLNISGLVCISCVFDIPHLLALNVPVVYVNRFFTGVEMMNSLRYSSIQPDYRQAGYLAAEELAGKGSRKAGYITGLQEENVETKRQGFIEFCSYFGMEYVGLPHIDAEDLMQAGYKKAEAYYALYPDIDGLYCDTDISAAGALTFFREAGIPVPEQVQLVGYGSLNRDTRYYYDLTHIRIPMEALSHEAADMIIEMAEGRSGHPREIVLQMSLARGKTTRP
ncbi:MAG: LacI family DNA-binding transcriptional regulator [Lachnospiraceae bacterium]|nr:LacI family DNA-binding transcriptional regulator [Lachnospiraceae bacterium]